MRVSGYAAGLVFLMLACSVARAAETKDDGWHFLVAPYVWFAGMDGTVGAKGTDVDVDMSFSDIAQDLDMAFMGQFEARKGRLAFAVSPVFMSLSDEADGPLGFIDAKGNMDSTIVDAFAAWEVVPGLDLLAGARYITLDVKLRLHANITGATVSRDGEKSWTDPIVGARYAHDFDDHWSITLRGDVGGGAGESDFVWNAAATVGYKVGDSGRIFLGYRALDYDYEDGNAADRFTFDMRIEGPVLGYGMTF